MTMALARVLSVGLGYLFGLFETGYLYGKYKHTDIREHGSGNTGSTNALRTFGIWGGIITLLGDTLKTMIAVFAVYFLFRDMYPEGVHLLMAYAGLGAILGHNFPFYMKFHGGKGIACTGGFILAFCIGMAPICLIAFITIVAVTKYVSLGSLTVVGLFFIQLLIFGNMGYLNMAPQYLNECYLIGAVIMILAVIRHRSNIAKLINGTENKISFKSSKKEEKHD